MRIQTSTFYEIDPVVLKITLEKKNRKQLLGYMGLHKASNFGFFNIVIEANSSYV